MTIRLLPRDEWPRLAGTLLEAVWPTLPEGAVVLVQEEGAAIIGCVALFPEWHLEGAWVAPGYRHRVGLARRFLGAVQGLLRGRGIREVWVMSTSGDAGRFARHLGHPVLLACQHFAVQLDGE